MTHTHTYHITQIWLVNGTKQQPRKCSIWTDNIERVRDHYRQLYTNYEILLKYKAYPIDKG